VDSDLALRRFGGRHWSAPAYLPYVQPPLTDEAVAAAERQLGVKLPADYLVLLRQQNGGYLRGSCGIAQCLRGIGPQFPSITRDEAWWRPKRARSGIWIPPESERLIPFDGDGHWDMCLDYRRVGPTGEPSITYVTCESKYEEPVAQTFAAYLGLLKDSLANEMRLYADLSPSSVAKRLAKKLGAPTPTADTFAHGFQQWRVQLQGEAQWIWCSPNLVPAGFARKGAKVIATEATALQIPEDPECRVLVSASDESRSRCLEALSELRLHPPQSSSA
jgi:hypothetical protein